MVVKCRILKALGDWFTWCGCVDHRRMLMPPEWYMTVSLTVYEIFIIYFYIFKKHFGYFKLKIDTDESQKQPLLNQELKLCLCYSSVDLSIKEFP